MIISPQNLTLVLSAVLAAVALLIIVISSLGKKSTYAGMALALSGFGFGLVLLSLEALGYFGSPQSPTITTTPLVAWPLLMNDYVSYIFGFAVLISVILVAITAVSYFKGGGNTTSFYAMLVFTTIGALLLAFSSDLLMMFVAWEMMSIPSYVLTGFKKKDTASNEAAVKYFIISAFASAILLYGISLIYALNGTTNIYQIVIEAGANGSGLGYVGTLALTFVLAGFGIKLAAVPFHMWIPDAYQGAPTIVSAILSTTTKLATFAPAARILFFSLQSYQVDWSLTFAVLAVLSMTFGNFAALTQKSVTRILAYSSIGQAGYIMIGLASGGITGLTGSFYHVLNYAIMQSCAFLAVAILIKELGSDNLDSFNGVGKRMIVAPMALSLSLLALGGFPPLNGFWSKLVLFYSAINANLGWLAIIGIINSFVSIAFYVRIIKHMYLDQAPSYSKLVGSRSFRVALIIGSILIIATGIYPYPFIQFASIAANSFLQQVHLLGP
jgi:proton-translocating NADH-quinone oxidoreductase chain N